jgi:hypothetical protein
MQTNRISRFLRAFAAPLAILLVASSCTSDTESTEYPAFPVTLPPTTSPFQNPDSSSVESTTTSVPAEPQVIVISPDDDASSIVDDAPEGSTFEFLPGIHRRFSVAPRNGTTFIGQEGAVLSGAALLTDAVETEGGWRFDGFEFTGVNHGKCIDEYEGCGLSQDLFFDDVMMWQVTDAADLAVGTWYWEGSSIYVFDDPQNRRVELSIDEYAFRRDSSDVTIRDLLIEKYATPAQSGAVQAQEPGNGARGIGWLVEDVEIRGAHGAGIRTGDETIVRRVYSHHNGQMGISVSGGTNVLVEDSEFAFNNIAGFRWAWEAGGSKFTRTDGLVIRENYAHDNIGPGLWTDIDNVNTLYESNRVIDNTGPGIFHEISYSAVIRDNHVEGNGFDFSSWLWGAGILIAASSDVEVVGNTVIDNANGIAGIQQDRGSGDLGEYLLARLNVHNNTIDIGDGQMGVVEDVGDPSVFTDRNNRFDYNTYVSGVARSYRWDGGQMSRGGWIDAGQDVNGTWE